MECQACHKANPDLNRFCEHCGVPLALKCPACGFDCASAAKFCGGCGKPLPRGYAEEPAATPPLVSAPPSGWGELKQATVLFADIVSSTEQIAQLDPEEAMDRLQPAVTLMCEAVERFGGTVIRTLGDGVMALFGVPKTLEGHARLACEAALQMQQAMARSSSGLSIRIGLHCGLVASDPDAHDGKGGGAHGLTIHLASRVIGLAPPGGVTMTQDCHELVRGFVEVDSLGRPPLKGIAEPVEIFRLRAFRPAFASQYFQQSKLTPFRGREKEMALLQQAQRLTEVGDAQVIGVSGGPGAGKSRLCYEFTQWCRARGRPVFEVRAQLYGSARPLQPVLELMRTFFFGIAAGDDSADCREKIAARLVQLGAAQAGDQELLCDFLDVAEEEGQQGAAMPPKARRARLLAIVSALMKHSAGTVSIILIEDMHWLDEASEEFVAALVDAISQTRTMVLLNYRSSYRSPWAGRENFREIEAADLSTSDTESIVRELISHRREFQDISQLIARRSGGNPFFAEELVRSLAERGVLSGEPDNPANGIDSVERALPATVQAVVGARIDRLRDDEKSVLQMCAIVGKEVPLGILERVTGSPRPQLDRALDALCQVELIQPQPAVGGRRFTFRHPLIQEVAYGTQMKAKRASIHLAVANAMEAYYAAQINEYAALVAHHYEAAGHWLEAAEYCGRSARWLSTSETAEAIKNWRKVRALLLGQPESAQANRLRATACSQIALLGWREGMSLSDVQPFIDEAMGLAREVDSRLTELLLMLEGRMVQASGGPSDWYVANLQEALALTRKHGDEGRKVVWAALSQAYGWAGLLEEALQANDAALSGAATIDSADRQFIGFDPEQWIMGMRGRLLTRLSRYHEALECWRRTLAADPATPIDPAIRAIVHLGQVEYAWCTDNVALAAEHARQVELLADSNAVPYLKTVAAYCLGTARALAGDLAAGIDVFSQAVDLVRSGNIGVEYETEILASLSECHRRNGDTALARSVAGEAIEISRQRSTRLPECRALITLGAALIDEAASGTQSDAEKAFAQAESLIGATGAVIYKASLLSQRSRLLADPAQRTGGVLSA
jgi:class 3 adenylate cyclase/tetratricopeptide (TPR) repeat protein